MSRQPGSSPFSTHLPATTTRLDAFQIFGMQPCYFVDKDALQKKFYELSKILHPDRFQTKSPQDLEAATYWSAQLNKAYMALKDDDERALYILSLAQVSLETKKTLPPELAEDYFSLLENLEEKPKEGELLLREFFNVLHEKMEKLKSERDETFREWERIHCPLDESGTLLLSKAQHTIQEKNYLESMIRDLEKKWTA